MLRFPHLQEQIFQKLDNESLFKCREVARAWQKVINGRNYPWLRIVNIPTILKKRRTYLHLAAETGQIEAFKKAFSEQDNKNMKNNLANFDNTPLGLACQKGHTNVVKFLMDNAADLRIDLNEKDINGRTTLGRTAFYIACIYGHSDVVKIFMDNAADLKIDLKMGKNLKSFFDICIRGNSGLVKVFLENAATFGINFNDLLDICLNKKKHELSKNGSRSKKRKKENCQNSPSKKKRYALDKNVGEKPILEDKEIKKENLKQALRDTIKNILKY